jgi:hypothetical protein
MSYDKDDNLLGRFLQYIVLKNPPVAVSVPGREYTGSRIQFDLQLLGSLVHGDDYELESGGDSWVIQAKREGRNGYYVTPWFDHKYFNFIDEITDEKENYFAVLEEYTEDFIAALDLQGIREIRIKDYSPEVITLGGFCEGTYYAVERPDLYVPVD